MTKEEEVKIAIDDAYNQGFRAARDAFLKLINHHVKSNREAIALIMDVNLMQPPDHNPEQLAERGLMTLRDDLIACKSVIVDPANWAKKPKSMHPACAFGAITLTLGSSPHNARWEDAVRALRAQVPREFCDSHEFCDIDDYNDAPGITHHDILALFDRAIEATK